MPWLALLPSRRVVSINKPSSFAATTGLRVLLSAGLAVALSAFCLAGVAPALRAQTAQFGFQQSSVSSSGFPAGVALDGSGNIYIAEPGISEVVKAPVNDLNCVAVGDCTTVGSNLSFPTGVAVDASGNVYIADFNNDLVLKVPPTDLACATAGDCTTVGSDLNNPTAVAVDASGNVYIADTNNNRVLVAPAADLTCATPSDCTTVASGAGLSTGLSSPEGVSVDASGNVYIADSGNNRVLKAPPSDLTCASAGDCTMVGSGLNFPQSVVLDGSGNAFISDTDNDRVLKAPAADLTCATATDCTAIGKNLASPWGIAVDGSGDVYIADTNNSILRVEQTAGVNLGTAALGGSTSLALTFTFTSAGTIGAPVVLTQGKQDLDFTAAGTGTCATNGTSFDYSTGDTCTVRVTFAPKYAGARYGAAELVNSSGAVIATAQVYGIGSGPQVIFSPAASSSLGGGFSTAFGLAVDAAGNVYASDGNNVKEIPTGCANSTCVTTLGGGFSQAAGLAIDGAGNLFVADSSNNAIKEIPAGCTSSSCVATLAGGFNNPLGVAVDANGNVYFADWGLSEVKEIPAGCASSSCTVTLGGGFGITWGVAVDSSRNVYVADPDNDAVYEMPPGCASSACLTSLGGGFSGPVGVAVDGGGNIYVSDNGSGGVKEMPPGCASSSCVTTLAAGSVSYPGVAVDELRNVYEDMTGTAVTELNRGTPPSLSFATTAAGSTSTDSPQTVTAENVGSQTLNVSAVGYATDFPEASGVDTDCSSSTVLAVANSAGDSCTLSIEFSPLVSSLTAPSTLLSEQVSLTDNALNVSNATQSVQVSGTETAVAPAITSPAPSSTIGGSTTFDWTPGDASGGMVWLKVGTQGRGSYDVYDGGFTSATSATVNVPTNGATLYVSLFYNLNGTLYPVNYTYTEAGSPTPPSMTSPTPGSTLSSASTTFQWSEGSGPNATMLYVGTTGQGSSNVYKGGSVNTTTASATVTVPANGATLYVTLFYYLNGTLHAVDYTYIEPGTPTLPAMTSPTPSSTLSSSSVTFQWTSGSATAGLVDLKVGTTGNGSSDIYNGTFSTATSATVTVPTNGVTLYVSLFYYLDGTLYAVDYTYVAGTPTLPAMISPAPGSTLTNSTVTFQWNPGSAAGGLIDLKVGTTGSGSYDVYKGSFTSATSATVTVPANGARLYVSLFYNQNGALHALNYTYTEP